MATGKELRRIALSLAGTVEAPHFDRSAFRVAKIYVTLPQDGKTANFLFTPEEQELRCSLAPHAYAPVPGGWGKMGYTTATLSALSVEELTEALRTAWSYAQPKAKKRKSKKGSDTPT